MSKKKTVGKICSPWINDCWNELDAVEKILEDTFFNGAPDWTEQSSTEVVLATHRTLKRKTGRKTESQILGATVGHQECLLEYLDRDLESAIEAILPDGFNSDVSDQYQEEIDNTYATFEKMCSVKGEALKNCRRRAAEDAPVDERLDFFKAYTKAREHELVKIADQISPREKVILVLTICWRSIQKMRDRSVVRRFIVKLFGKPGVYNSDFIIGICKHIKLKLANKGAPEK